MLQNPVALVTGGSRGIGRGICRHLAAAGYALGINFAGNLAAAQQTSVGIEHFLLLQGDISLGADRALMVDRILESWGRIDLLVNNAGIAPPVRSDILEASEESWDRVLRVNLKGPYFLSQRVANEMILRKDVLLRPAIINITSISANTASINRGDYCVSKAGMSMATQLFAVRLAEYGIRVFEVRPGVIETDMTSAVKDLYLQRIADGLTPIKRIGSADDVGKVVAHLATSDLAYSTGDVWNVDGGFHLRRL